MKRTLWIALLFAGAGVSAIGQDTPDTAPVPEENALAPENDRVLDEPEIGADVAPAAEPLVDDPGLPGENLFDPDDPAAPINPVEPATPLDAGVEPIDPLAEDPGVEPINSLAEEPVAPAPRGNARERLPDPTIDVTPADPLDDPLRQPTERDPLAPSINPGPPIPPNGTSPAARPMTRPDVDPAYGAPAPRREQPQTELKDVVRDPVRIHDARLMVLMNHESAAKKAIETLGNRFPTDARVEYLKFYMLSRTGKKDAALDALQNAVALERLYPMTDYDRFMEPMQGPDRFYAERVRRAASELSSAGGLVEPDENDYLPKGDNNR